MQHSQYWSHHHLTSMTSNVIFDLKSQGRLKRNSQILKESIGWTQFELVVNQIFQNVFNFFSTIIFAQNNVFHTYNEYLGQNLKQRLLFDRKLHVWIFYWLKSTFFLQTNLALKYIYFISMDVYCLMFIATKFQLLKRTRNSLIKIVSNWSSTHYRFVL